MKNRSRGNVGDKSVKAFSDRKLSIVAGGMFILATAMGVINAVLLAPLLGASDMLGEMARNADKIGFSTLLNIIMAGAVIAIAVVLYPIL